MDNKKFQKLNTENFDSFWLDFDENLEEDIEKHETLNPKLWNEDATLKPEIEAKIQEIVQYFLTQLQEDGIKINVEDIILVGSNCSFNYTKDSDLDIHIIADTSSLKCPDQLYPLLYSAYRSLFNNKYNISFYGIPVEIYVEVENSPRVSNGCYSVLHHSWLTEPSQTAIPEIDMDEFNAQFEDWDNKYNNLLKTNADTEDTIARITQLIEEIYNLRKEGLAEPEAEYSLKNLIFKEFRNRGYLDKLKELKNELIGRTLSLESLVTEDTKKIKDHKWVNKGKAGSHGTFKTKKEADAQRKAMFANGWHESLEEDLDSKLEDYAKQIQAATNYFPIMQENGLFEIYNLSENTVNLTLMQVKNLDFVQWAQKAVTNFNAPALALMNVPQRKYKIYGQVEL